MNSSSSNTRCSGPRALHDRWSSLVAAEHDSWTWGLLTGAYHQPHRAYHALDHIIDCVNVLDGVSGIGADEKRVAELALFFHDFVYVPGDPDNEALSADILIGMTRALRFSSHDVERASLAVRATAHKAPAFDDLQKLVVDVDLSILAAGPNTYARYLDNVRFEFRHVSDDAWRVGRTNFLASMLARDRLFAILVDHERPARANMAAELAALEAK